MDIYYTLLPCSTAKAMLIVYPGTQSINVLVIDFMFQYSNSSFIRLEVKYGDASLNTAFYLLSLAITFCIARVITSISFSYKNDTIHTISISFLTVLNI